MQDKGSISLTQHSEINLPKAWVKGDLWSQEPKQPWMAYHSSLSGKAPFRLSPLKKTRIWSSRSRRSDSAAVKTKRKTPARKLPLTAPHPAIAGEARDCYQFRCWRCVLSIPWQAGSCEVTAPIIGQSPAALLKGRNASHDSSKSHSWASISH